MSVGAYQNLLTYLGRGDLGVKLMSKIWQSVFVDKSFLERFCIDYLHIWPVSQVADESDVLSEDHNGHEIFAEQWGIKRNGTF